MGLVNYFYQPASCENNNYKPRTSMLLEKLQKKQQLVFGKITVRKVSMNTENSRESATARSASQNDAASGSQMKLYILLQYLKTFFKVSVSTIIMIFIVTIGTIPTPGMQL